MDSLVKVPLASSKTKIMLKYHTHIIWGISNSHVFV